MRAMRFVTGSLFVVLTQASCCSENWTVFFVPHVVLADLGVGKGFMQLIAALTCTRLHSHVHACTHIYTPATLTCTCLHSHVHAFTHMYTPALTCTRLPLSHAHAFSHMYMFVLTCTRLHSHVHACHSHMYTPALTCTRLHSHVHAYTHMYTPAALTCTCLHSHVHACRSHMYTPPLTCTRLHSHVHACRPGASCCYLLSWGVGKPLATAIWPQKLLSFQASVLTTARFVPHLLLAVLGCG